jgi:integrase
MAFIRERRRKDGSSYFSVTFTLADGTQTSVSYNDRASAQSTEKLVDAVGGDRALDILGLQRRERSTPLKGMTVAQWLTHYIDHLTGVDQGTTEKYRAYVRNDIEPILGSIPLIALGRDDVAKWMQWLQEFGAADRNGNRRQASAKTIANKHGFLSAALAAAVPKHIPANPAAERRLPQGGASEADEEMVFLSATQFDTLLSAVTEYWRPLVEFLVASGCRWGEATALRPTDIDRAEATVRIRRAWTYSKGGHRLVKPKGKSRRTINVPTGILGKLDYSHDWLFVNRRGDPVRAASFHGKVWKPALKRARLDPAPRIHDLRHTCASWMIAASVPLPVIQAHLGHQSVLTTVNVYGHLDRSSFRQAADAVAAVLGGVTT